MTPEKEIRWVGSAYDDLLEFPVEPRRDAGFQLSKVQSRLDPEDWKPFGEVVLVFGKSASGTAAAFSG